MGRKTGESIMDPREKLDKPVCDMCAFGPELFAEREKEMFEKYGWIVHHVFDDHNHPYDTNIHTHGVLESFKHPDLQLCIPISPEITHHILSNMVGLIKEGKMFKPRTKYSGKGIIKNYDIYIAEAKEGDRTVLRVILPDKENKLMPNEIESGMALQWQGTL